MIIYYGFVGGINELLHYLNSVALFMRIYEMQLFCYILKNIQLIFSASRIIDKANGTVCFIR